MAEVIPLESGWTNSNDTGGSNPSHSHAVVAGSDRVLVAMMAWKDSSDATNVLTAMTAGGQSMTELVADDAHSVIGSGGDGVKIWYMKEAQISSMSGGAFGYTWDADGIPDREIRLYTRYFSDVDQSRTIAASSNDNGTGGTSALQILAAQNHRKGDISCYIGTAGNPARTASIDGSYVEEFDDAGTYLAANGGIREWADSATTQPTVTWDSAARLALAVGVLPGISSEVTLVSGLRWNSDEYPGFSTSRLARGDYQIQFYVDNTSDLKYIWSEDNWATTSMVTVRSGTVCSFQAMGEWASFIDSYIVWIVYADETADSLRLARIDLEAGTISTADTEIGSATVGEIVHGNPYFCHPFLAIARNGDVHVALKESTDGGSSTTDFDYTKGWVCTDGIGSSWTAENIYAGLGENLPTTDANMAGTTLFGACDSLGEDDADFLLFIAESSAKDVEALRRDHSAGTWDTPVTIWNASASAQAIPFWFSGAPAIHSDGDPDFMAHTQHDNAVDDLNVYRVNADADPLTADNLTDIVVNTSEMIQGTVTVRQATDDEYVFWGRGAPVYGTSTNILYSIYDHEGGTPAWSTPAQWSTTPGDLRNIMAPATIDAVKGGYFTPAWHDDNNLTIIQDIALTLDWRRTNLVPRLTLMGVG